jgi:hypothetical protein
VTEQNLLDSLTDALEQKNYSSALEIYRTLYRLEPSFFVINPTDNNTLNQIRHSQNAASLARMSLFESLKPVRDASERLSEMVNIFIGTSNRNSKDLMQCPSFLYIPDLPSQPFFSCEQVLGLREFVEEISNYKSFLRELPSSKFKDYVETVGNIPLSEEWKTIRDNRWTSTHLINGGEPILFEESQINSLIELFLENDLICHCSSHAPEVFVSVLDKNTQIPEHFGVSNAKLTVQIPLDVTNQASLTVANQTRKWDGADMCKIFDDSFKHSANNFATTKRSVLIFDIWNPFLSSIEKKAIVKFFKEFNSWHKKFGMLANLDDKL